MIVSMIRMTHDFHSVIVYFAQFIRGAQKWHLKGKAAGF
jgi:hypothetical protein